MDGSHKQYPSTRIRVSVLIGGAAVLPAAMDPQIREQAPARRAAVAPEDGQSGRHARPQDRARDLPAGRAARAHGRGNHRSSTVRRTAAADRRHAVASRRSRRTRRGQALNFASPCGTRTIFTFGEPDRRRRRIRVPQPGHARHARHARRRNGSQRADRSLGEGAARTPRRHRPQMAAQRKPTARRAEERRRVADRRLRPSRRRRAGGTGHRLLHAASEALPDQYAAVRRHGDFDRRSHAQGDMGQDRRVVRIRVRRNRKRQGPRNVRADRPDAGGILGPLSPRPAQVRAFATMPTSAEGAHEFDGRFAQSRHRHGVGRHGKDL